MAINYTAYDPDGNGLGVSFVHYLYSKYASFTDVVGILSTDALATQYVFTDGSGNVILLGSSGGWTVDAQTGSVSGTLDSIRFGHGATSGADGLYSMVTELDISGLSVSNQTALDTLFTQVADGRPVAIFTDADYAPRNITGSESKDNFRGSDGNDVFHGKGGNDLFYGGFGDDVITGGEGNDRLAGQRGNDTIYGNDGNDHINGGTGNDILKGGAGNDTLIGGTGEDRLYGGDGDDFLSGGRYSDILRGGKGNDTLWGGSSPDTFIFEKDAGDDVINDFAAGKAGKDVIIFEKTELKSFADVLDHADYTGAGTLISYGDSSLFLKGVHLDALDKNDFLFR